MTNLPITFAIRNLQSEVRVFGVRQVVASNTLPANVSFVEFDGVTISGKITYNDRLSLPEQFTDPSPYQNYINQWITAASTATTLPISLPQSQAVKSSLLDAVWATKRQLPISVVTSLGTFTFDANDVLSSANNTTSLLSIIGSAVTNLNASASNSISAVNSGVTSDFASIKSEINNGLNAFSAQNNALWNATYPVPGPGPPGGLPPNWSVSTYTLSAAYTYTGPLASLPPVKILPVGATSYPAFTVSDLVAVLTAVKTQHDATLLVRAQKQAAIAALGTIPAVVAYDITTGW